MLTAATQQAPVLEEDVYELPQDVVERLHELLSDVAIAGRRAELPFRSRLRKGDGQRPELASLPHGARRATVVLSDPEGDCDVVGRHERGGLGRELCGAADEGEGGQRALADDDRVQELDGVVTRY